MEKPKTKIIFICHGNICRSTMAESIAKELFERENIVSELPEKYGDVEIYSRAVSDDALGSPPYHLTIKELKNRGYHPEKYLEGKRAKRLCEDDFKPNCHLYYMDDLNRRNLERYYGKNAKRCSQLLPQEIDDPWYTRDFASCFEDIKTGVDQLLTNLKTGKL